MCYTGLCEWEETQGYDLGECRKPGDVRCPAMAQYEKEVDKQALQTLRIKLERERNSGRRRKQS